MQVSSDLIKVKSTDIQQNLADSSAVINTIKTTATSSNIIKRKSPSFGMLNRFLKSSTVSSTTAISDSQNDFSEDEEVDINNSCYIYGENNENHGEKASIKKSKGKKNLQTRDSGIISDIFHLGSMNNLKARLSSASQSIRNSLSVFSLKQHQQNDSEKLNTPSIERVKPSKQSGSKMTTYSVCNHSVNASNNFFANLSSNNSTAASKSNIFTSFDENNQIKEG